MTNHEMEAQINKQAQEPSHVITIAISVYCPIRVLKGSFGRRFFLRAIIVGSRVPLRSYQWSNCPLMYYARQEICFSILRP
jgi:hypothetical protein